MIPLPSKSDKPCIGTRRVVARHRHGVYEHVRMRCHLAETNTTTKLAPQKKQQNISDAVNPMTHVDFFTRTHTCVYLRGLKAAVRRPECDVSFKGWRTIREDG